MAKDFAVKFYNSKAWKKCRLSYIAKRIAIDGGVCEICHREAGYIVHHKILLTKDNIYDHDITLNHKHLIYECKSCHDKEEEHFVKFKPLICSFDTNGQPVPSMDTPP